MPDADLKQAEGVEEPQRSSGLLTPAPAIFTLKAMEVELTPEQQAFIRQAIETGRLHRPEEAVREALSLWEERERSRVELLLAFDEAEADLEAGHYTDYTNETLPQLADELKREARSMRECKPRS